MKETLPSRVRFGVFELDVKTGELRTGGRRMVLQEQPLQVLRMLVERECEIVTREEIKKKLWPNDTAVEFDHGINTVISNLRRALGDSADEPKYIETLARRGYRLVVPVEWVDAAGPSIAHSVALPMQHEVFGLIGKKVSHYRVLEVIGGGGMGLVYKAEDLKLGRPVALKFLPEELASDAVALKRFEREAQTASSLNHPNICTIYEVEEHQDEPFIVMELLEGETLRDRLLSFESRAVPLAQLLDIALQICDGLQAAHQKGIIHRDVKPANIFLTTSGQVKILDFGLAKLLMSEEPVGGEDAGSPVAKIGNVGARERVAADATLTRTGSAMGTAGYMSPEQVRGEKLDARTDLFSFGLVLYEMATGQRAFTGETVSLVHDAIANEAPIPIRELNSTLPVKLVTTIDKALEKDRERRYQSAAEMRDDLQKTRHNIPESPLRRHRRLLFATAVMLIPLIAGGSYWRRLHSADKLNDNDTLVLADFTNSTGDPVFDGALNTALSTELRQSPFLNLLSLNKVRGALKAMNRSATDRLTYETAMMVCKQTNSTGVVAGSITDAGNQYRIGLSAINCQTDKTLATAQKEAKGRDQVIKTLGIAGNELRSKLGEPAAYLQNFSKPLDMALSWSPDALQAYTKGYDELRQRGYSDAIPYFRRAIDLDPNFVLAYGTLVARELETDGGDSYWKKEYEMRDRLTQRDRLQVEGAYYSGYTGEKEKAIQTYTDWVHTYPRDSVPHNNLSVVLREVGHYQRAETEAREAVRMTPNDYTPVYNLILSAIGMNRLDEAKTADDEARARNLEPTHLGSARYVLAFLQNDQVMMQNQVKSASGKAGNERILDLQADTDAYYGRFGWARESSRRAVESTERANEQESAAEYMGSQAWREAAIGNVAEARNTASHALVLSSNEKLEVNFFALLALAETGDSTQAEKLAKELSQRRPLDTLVQEYWIPSIRAAIEVENNNPRRAIGILQMVRPYEMSPVANLYPIYLRGQAYLKAGNGKEAAAEFQKILDHPGITLNSVRGALAHLQLGRAQVMISDKTSARKSYQDFFTLWKDADPDIPIYKQAKAEYARLK